jgi:gluconate kinase
MAPTTTAWAAHSAAVGVVAVEDTKMQKVYLVCGVPGAGKSWVCNQLTEKFTYVPNDDYIGGDHLKEVYRAARASEKPVLVDCPFAERTVRDNLINNGVDVIPVFIVESPQTVKRRYESREGKPVSQSTLTRAMSIAQRAIQWRAFQGTSEKVLEHLKGVQ